MSSEVFGVVFMIALGLVGAMLGHRLNIPAGVLAGAVFGTGIGSALMEPFPEGSSLPGFSSLVQILVGILVGTRISRASMSTGGKALLPAVILTFGMLVIGVCSALLAVSMGALDLPTALFAAIPGGITEMSSVGASLGADGAAVLSVHLVRLLITITTVNLLLARGDFTQTRSQTDCSNENKISKTVERKVGRERISLLLVAGTCGGVTGISLGIPAGGVIGALLCSALVRMCSPGRIDTRGLLIIVQLVGGLTIGSSITQNFFGDLADLLGATILLVGMQLLLWIICSWLLRSLFSYSRLTALFASAPGGMGELIATAANTDADLTTITFTHLVRLSLIILVVPLLISIVFAG